MRTMYRITLHSILIFTGLILIMVQMIWGIIPFVGYTDESTRFLSRLLAILWLEMIAVGLALRDAKPNIHCKRFYTSLFFANLIIIGLPLAFGAFTWSLDMRSSGADYTGGNLYFGLDSLGSQVVEWVYIVKIIFLCIPAGIVIYGVVGFFYATDWDEYTTAIIEVFGAVLLVVGANYVFQLVGINLFDLGTDDVNVIVASLSPSIMALTQLTIQLAAYPMIMTLTM